MGLRVNSRIVIDIESGSVLERESFDYDGPVAEAKGGGKSTTTTSTTLPEWLRPYATKFIESYQGLVYDENGNVIQQPEDLNQEIAGFTPYQSAALQGIATLSGYPGSTPYARTPKRLASPTSGYAMDVSDLAVNQALPSGGINAQDVANMAANQSATTLGGAYLWDPTGNNPYLRALRPTMAGAYTLNPTGSNPYLAAMTPTITGQFLNANPYLDATYEQAARRMADVYSTATAPGIIAAAQRSGNFGGSAMDEALALSRKELATGLGDLATDIYGGNYAAERARQLAAQQAAAQLYGTGYESERARQQAALNTGVSAYGAGYEGERARQLQALGLTPSTIEAIYAPSQALLGAGSFEQAQRQQELDTAYMNALSRFGFPFEILSGFGGALGQAGMGAGTSTVTQSRGGGGMFGSVICTELHRQGLMDDETFAADDLFGKTLPADVIRGYHAWAIPLARAMRHSRILTRIVAPLALSWAKTMRAKIEGKPENETLFGNLALRFGAPLCALIGRMLNRKGIAPCFS